LSGGTDNSTSSNASHSLAICFPTCCNH